MRLKGCGSGNRLSVLGHCTRWALLGGLLATGACGFGTYDGGSEPNVTDSNSGVPDAGQWWPFVCPDGSNPSPDEPSQSYSAAGSCGDGGTLTMNVDGCELLGNWDVLGLADVETTVPTSTPDLGGWTVLATPGVGSGDAGVPAADAGWTCTASVPAAVGAPMTFTCSAGDPPTTACTSTLTPVSGT